jgi:hypothetical protein
VIEPDLTLNLGPPLAPIISINRIQGAHWALTRPTKVAWRDGVAWMAKGGRIPGLSIVRGKPCALRFVLPFEVERRRDPSNYVDTVVKWSVDGLVQAGVWEDDSPEFVEVMEPLLVKGKDVRIQVWLRQEVAHA